MAGAGYRDWTAGDVPTATQFDTYLQEQTVMVFASAAARDTALSTAKSEGMVAYLLDLNALTIYTGSVWSYLIQSAHGALTSWTPTLTQLGTVTKTVSYASYRQVGRLVTAQFRLDATGAGTATNKITVSLPVTAVAVSSMPVGVGWFFDASTGAVWPQIAVLDSATVLSFFTAATSASIIDSTLGAGTSTFNGAMASGDALAATVTYEAAAD